VLQQLEGFTGKITIVRDYLRQLRGKRKQRIAYARFESAPGEQMQVDWGHFGSLEYGDTRRKLYALVVDRSLQSHDVRSVYAQPKAVLLCTAACSKHLPGLAAARNNWWSITWPPPSSNAGIGGSVQR
jgi:predicted DNA-binding protein (MmcQ/YjbR family)